MVLYRQQCARLKSLGNDSIKGGANVSEGIFLLA